MGSAGGAIPSRALLSPRIGRLLAWLIVAAGVFFAVLYRWTCDDAFITFRYARNLVEGHGLVFNPGERVEGYTNFLWTLWSAVGLWLGLSAEAWADFWSIGAFGGSLLLLLRLHSRFAEKTNSKLRGLPIAALAAALHPDWQIYASSGLETSLFTFLLLAGYFLVSREEAGWRLSACAGLLMGAAFLTRQDGVIPAFVMGLYILWAYRRPIGSALAYTLSFSLLAAPFLAWRLSYYGQLLPNTYYAKSANLTWYSQGWEYVSLYFWRYWALLFVIPLLIAVRLLTRKRNFARDNWQPLLLAASIALAYSFYVMRVGGDFMFARMLIPATPFFLILLELGILLVAASTVRAPAAAAFALLLTLGIALTPSPVTAENWHHGIANEWMYYSPQRVRLIEDRAAALKKYFDGLPVRMAYLGAEARVAYLARIPIVIDCYGLTDAHIARLPLEERRRVGHEKLPGAEYLIEERKVHFIFNAGAVEELSLERHIPIHEIQLDQVNGFLLHWDPAMMESLKERGARFESFPARLDEYLERAGTLLPEQLESDFRRYRLFYFDHVSDPERERRFEQVLSRVGKTRKEKTR